MRGPYRKRCINLPPNFQNFKPSGIPRHNLDSLVLTIDEYEAIRLADYLNMEHARAAENMKISRPTFTRLIDKARQKIAQVIVEGKELIIEGGNVDFVHTLLYCLQCGKKHKIQFGKTIDNCPGCGSTELENLAYKFLGKGTSGGKGWGRGGRR